jgi:hypothetical protein
MSALSCARYHPKRAKHILHQTVNNQRRSDDDESNPASDDRTLDCNNADTAEYDRKPESSCNPKSA